MMLKKLAIGFSSHLRDPRFFGYVIVSLFAAIVFAANLLPFPAALAGISCVLLAILFAFFSKDCYGSIVRVRAVFCSTWILAVGVSLFRIHPLQNRWCLVSTLCVAIVPALFLIGSHFGERLINVVHDKTRRFTSKGEQRFCPLPGWVPAFLLGMIITIGLSLDYLYSGVLPIFSSDQSAYMTFGMPFVHYLTVLCALYPGYLFVQSRTGAVKNAPKFIKLILSFFVVVSLAIPVLIVSRQLLMMEFFVLAVAVVFSMSIDHRIKITWVLIAAMILVLIWCTLSLFRNQSAAYLAQVFLLPHSDNKIQMSLWQLYLYIGFNFDNFDYLVRNYRDFTLGVSSLFPLFVLTGFGAYAKGVVGCIELPMKLPTYTTRSLIETPYMDAAVIGVIVYILILGLFAIVLERFALANRCCCSSVISYAVLLYGLLISFFVDEFALPVFWVYLIILALLQIITQFCQDSKSVKE